VEEHEGTKAGALELKRGRIGTPCYTNRISGMLRALHRPGVERDEAQDSAVAATARLRCSPLQIPKLLIGNRASLVILLARGGSTVMMRSAPRKEPLTTG